MKAKNQAVSALPDDTQPSTQSPETVAFFKKYERSFDDMCIVLAKFQVTPMLFHMVGVELENCYRSLITGEIYTPQELVGDQWWAPYDGAWRHEIVLCLRHFGAYPDFNLRYTDDGNFERLGYQVNR
jgi:hypothetical protein